jgi:hypothetical protein
LPANASVISPPLPFYSLTAGYSLLLRSEAAVYVACHLLLRLAGPQNLRLPHSRALPSLSLYLDYPRGFVLRPADNWLRTKTSSSAPTYPNSLSMRWHHRHPRRASFFLELAIRSQTCTNVSFTHSRSHSLALNIFFNSSVPPPMSPTSHLALSYDFLRFVPPISPSVFNLNFTIILAPTPALPFSPHPYVAASNDPFLASVVQHYEIGENIKFLGRHSTN